MPTISPPSTVLVTGASGFVAVHVAKTFLERGYSVVGSVRSPSKGAYLADLFERDFPGRFRAAVVPDIAAPGAFDNAVRGVDGIAHVASPCHHLDDVGADAFIAPAVEGTLGLLRSAAQFGTQLKRVVLTSSNATILERHDPPYEYSDRDWCEFAVEEVRALGDAASGVAKYMASKVLAERAANEWIAGNSVPFDITHVLPAWVYGAPIQDVATADALNISVRRVHEWFVAELPREQLVTESGWYIDARDVGRAHVDALEREELGGRRLILSRSENPAYQDVYDAYWALDEGEQPKLPIAAPRGVSGIADEARKTFSTHETAEAVLGWQFRGLGETIAWTLEGIMDKGLFTTGQ